MRVALVWSVGADRVPVVFRLATNLDRTGAWLP